MLLDDVPAAIGILMGETHAPQTNATADEVQRLMCAVTDDREREAIRAEIGHCESIEECARVAPRHIKRRLKVVAMKRKAGPGPSGWRNSYIAGVGETKGGIAQLRLWTELWTRGQVQ